MINNSTCIVIDIFKSVWGYGIINKERMYMNIYFYNSSCLSINQFDLNLGEHFLYLCRYMYIYSL